MDRPPREESPGCAAQASAQIVRFGAEKSGSRRLAERVDLTLSAPEARPLEPPADRHYAKLRGVLTRQGTPIGPNDLLIAAQARARDLAVVTANAREFSRVPDLKVEDWLSA